MAASVKLDRTLMTGVRTAITLLAELADILAGAVLLTHFGPKRKIDPNKIYTSTEIAKFLGTKRVEVVKLILSEEIKAKKIDTNYRILGQSVLNYLGGVEIQNPSSVKGEETDKSS